MEENKNCCEGTSCEKCEGCCFKKCCFRKCPMLKHLLWVVLIILAFYLGTQMGELKSEARGCRFMDRDGMMDWNYKKVKPQINEETPSTPNTQTPEAVQ